MTTITTNNSSSVMNINDLVNYILNDFAEPEQLNNPTKSIFHELNKEDTQKSTHEDHTYYIQNSIEKVCTEPSLHTLTTKIKKAKIQIPSESKQEMVDGINRLRQKTQRPLEEIQLHYARALKVDVQEIKKIYSCYQPPNIQKKSKVKTIHPFNSKCLILPESKQEMIGSINQLGQKTKKPLEEIQTIHVPKLVVTLQDVKKFYKTSETKTINFPYEWMVPPESKKEMVDGINRIFQRTKSSLEEIQTHYANKLNVDIQDVKNIYSAVCQDCPTALTTSKIKTRTFNNFL
jgi:hypothetical protein